MFTFLQKLWTHRDEFWNLLICILLSKLKKFNYRNLHLSCSQVISLLKFKMFLFLAFGCMNLSLSLFSRCVLIWIFLSKSPKHKHSHLWEGSLCFKWNTKWSSLFRSENQLDVYIVTCVYACMCGHVCSAVPMEVRRPQILELEMAVSCQVDVENWTRVPCKSSKSS